MVMLQHRIVEVIDQFAFRDWEFRYNGYNLTIFAYFPNRDQDVRDEQEDSYRRWLRSKVHNKSIEYCAPEKYDPREEIPQMMAPQTEMLSPAASVCLTLPAPIFYDEIEVVRFLYGACVQMSDHEIRENIYWRGKRVFDPHGNAEIIQPFLEVEYR